MSSVIVVTVDGPSGVGKGTLCARLAEHYGYHFLDSGALYRVLGLAARQRDILDNPVALTDLARHLPVRFTEGKILLETQDVSDTIRTETVAALASQVAVIETVRAALLAFQQDFAQAPGLVADGRDMGTVVFPQACAKLFLDASAEVRADRRVKQLKNQGLDANIDQITKEIRERDERDRNRAVAPLKAAGDALVIDTSNLSPEQVFTQAIAWVDQQSAYRAQIV
ncbi:MAG: (d)CMP kinase [Gammaproteobacteria bacterium]|nr:(d)CMP kinase [Gammaproteobacteria bacterium]